MTDFSVIAWFLIAGMAFATLAALIGCTVAVLLRRDPYKITIEDISAEGPNANTVRGLFLSAFEAHVKLNKMREAAAERRWDRTEIENESEIPHRDRPARRERKDHGDR